MRIRLFLSFVLFLSAPLLADTIYTYTGHPFTHNITAPYTTSNYVRGSFTVASPLAPNTIYKTGNCPPTSYIFTDGIDTFSNSFFHDGFYKTTVKGPYTPVEMDVETDGSGNIYYWFFLFASSADDDALVTANGFGLPPSDSAFKTTPYSGGAVDGDAGTWTFYTQPVIKPIPPWDSQIIANLPPNFVPLDFFVDSTPVPEPQSLLLLTTGVLGGLVSIRRRIHA